MWTGAEAKQVGLSELEVRRLVVEGREIVGADLEFEFDLEWRASEWRIGIQSVGGNGGRWW